EFSHKANCNFLHLNIPGDAINSMLPNELKLALPQGYIQLKEGSMEIIFQRTFFFPGKREEAGEGVFA
ncbi:hypothetical protein ACJX0J_008744, partial [Zea mays]